MKVIKYRFLSAEVNRGTEQEPDIEQTFLDKSFCCETDESLEQGLAIAQREAYNGEYTVEEVEDPVTEPTQLDALEAQVVYTAMMTDTLLEEV